MKLTPEETKVFTRTLRGMQSRRSKGSVQRFVPRQAWTWKALAQELYDRGQEMRARLEAYHKYSDGWDVVASFTAKKLKKKKPGNC